VARATGPQEIETFPQFQLEEQKLEDLKGQRSLSEAMGVGNYHDLARDTKHFLNDETGIAEICAGSEKTKSEESASKMEWWVGRWRRWKRPQVFSFTELRNRMGCEGLWLDGTKAASKKLRFPA
jgi:hypothetical protein